MTEPLPARSSIATTVAIAVIAYALCDLVHEVAGHGVAALVVPGVQVVSLSSVALQTTGESRIVAAAGSMANILIGGLALVFFGRQGRFSSLAYFAWLFGSLNLLNGSGYPLYSAVLGFGDWEVVVRGLQPPAMWRVALGLAGAAAYAGAVILSARALSRFLKKGLVSFEDVPRLVVPAYLAGGVLLVAASALNPIDPSLVFTSGVSSGFAAMAGLLLVPKMVYDPVRSSPRGEGVLSRSTGWILAGLVIGILFVAVVGRGVQFQ